MGPYAVPGSLTVYWQSNDTLIAALIANAAEVSPTTAVNAVSLSINETACDLESTTPWLGFAPRWRYARAGEVN